jgi:hypothetical protein
VHILVAGITEEEFSSDAIFWQIKLAIIGS